MDDRNGTTLLVLAAATAFSVSFVAVAQHVGCVSLGYDLDGARLERRSLMRSRAAIRGDIARLRTPSALLARADDLGLDLGYPAPDAVPGSAPQLAPVARLEGGE
jgi:uncharacterized membrane protein YbhN (UPF0104 family)